MRLTVVGSVGSVGLVTWLAIVLVSACGSDRAQSDAGNESGPPFDAGSSSDRNQAAPGALCERLSTIQCAGEAHCCEKPGRDYATCKKAMMSGCAAQLHLDDIAKQANTGFDAQRATAAFSDFEALAARCDPSIAAWGSSSDGLRGILQGTVAHGKNCAPMGAVNDPTIGGAALASCLDPAGYSCQPRASSSGGKLNWTCDAHSPVDGLCYSDVNCKDELYCNNPQNRLGAKCAARKADGMPCNMPNECLSLVCRSNACARADQQAAYCLAQ